MALGAAALLHAEDSPWPGDSLFLGSRVEAEFPNSGRALRFGLDLDSSRNPSPGRTSLEIGLASISAGNDGSRLAAFGGLAWGWLLRPFGALCLAPALSGAAMWQGGALDWRIGASLPLEIRLLGGKFLRAALRADYSLTTGAIQESIAIGFKTEVGLPLPEPPQRPSLRLEPAEGVAPDRFALRLSSEPARLARAWRLEARNPDGSLYRRWEGAGAPVDLLWDGRDERGLVPEEERKLELLLSVEDRLGKDFYDKGKLSLLLPRQEPTLAPPAEAIASVEAPLPETIASEATSPGIAASEERPELVLLVSSHPALFSPDGDGENDSLVIDLDARPAQSIASWELRVLSPDGSPFRAWAGPGAPPASLSWDGLSDSGELVGSALEYPLIAGIADSTGMKAEARGSIRTDLLVLKEGDTYKIRIASIVFDANSGSLVAADTGILESNRRILERLAAIFRQFPNYSILVEGHGNLVRWQDKAAAAAEQANEVLPLSLARAKSVKAALVGLGIDAKRIGVTGRGGSRPIVPFSQADEIWKNRRVEFYLEKR